MPPDIKLSDDEQNYYDELYKTAIISNEKIYKDLAERYLSQVPMNVLPLKRNLMMIFQYYRPVRKRKTKGDASEIAQID